MASNWLLVDDLLILCIEANDDGDKCYWKIKNFSIKLAAINIHSLALLLDRNEQFFNWIE